MTEQQFLIALLREFATGSKSEDIQKAIIDRMASLEEARSGNKLKTFNEFKEKYFPNDTTHVSQKYSAPVSDFESNYNTATCVSLTNDNTPVDAVLDLFGVKGAL